MIPLDLYPESDDRRRAQAALAMALLSLPFAAVVLAVFRAQGKPLLGFAVAVPLLGIAGAVLSLLRRGARLGVAGNLAAGLWLLTFSLLAYLRGGLGSLPLMVVPLTPLVATLISGWRSGVAWTLIVGLDIAGWTIADHLGVSPSDSFPTDLEELSQTIAPILMTVLVALLATVFEGARVRAVDERQRALAEAGFERTSRLVAVGQLAAGVAHEINNPLSYAISNLDIVLDEAGLTGDHRAALTEAREGAIRVRNIVGDLRSFARKEPESHGPADAKRAMDAAIKMASNEIVHRARLVLDLADVPPVAADERRLVQVYVNLLVNAAQAVVRGTPEDNEIRVSMAQAGPDVIVEVQDTGCGMSAEVMRNVFTPFYTTKPIGVGTGLGLSVCRNLIEGYGGTIELESREGQGTTVRVHLPGARESISPPERIDAPPPPATHGSKRQRVLVIDDEAGVRTAIRRILRSHDVVLAGSGHEALALLADDQTPPFDLVLCDVMMPDLSGAEICRRLEEDDPSILDRVVLMSGGVFGPTADALRQQRPLPILTKPFDAEAVRGLLHRASGELRPDTQG